MSSTKKSRRQKKDQQFAVVEGVPDVDDYEFVPKIAPQAPLSGKLPPLVGTHSSRSTKMEGSEVESGLRNGEQTERSTAGDGDGDGEKDSSVGEGEMVQDDFVDDLDVDSQNGDDLDRDISLPSSVGPSSHRSSLPSQASAR